MLSFKFACVLVIACQKVGAVPWVDPLVDSKAGLIRGQAAADGDYSMFLGIPYAKVDEANPFGRSFPHPVFEGIFEAFDDSVVCPQVSEMDKTQVFGTLDCLRLNIYVPSSASSNNPLPVLIWIHGGAFQSGFSGKSVYGPKFLVRHNVILITFNYRLGPYGFLCLETAEAPGNQGLKDQRLALKWVKDHIEAFGGDVNKITIFGESSGAGSVDFHVHLDQDNLFSQVILQSGTIVTPVIYEKANNDVVFKLSEHLGFLTNDVHDALSFLASANSSVVIASSRDLGLMFMPCVENDFDDVQSFLTDHPMNLRAKSPTVPILIGFANDECIIAYDDFDADYFAKNDLFRERLKNGFTLDDDIFREMRESLKYFYFGDKIVNNESKREFLNFCLDFQYIYPTLRTMRKLFDSGTESVFTYMFSYTGEVNYFKKLHNITYGGASHADDLSYLFDVQFVDDVVPAKDQIVVDRITTLWTNFAKYGDPTPETSDLLPIKWIPATRSQWNYLNIDSELTMETSPFHQRLAYLDLFYKMYRQYQTGYNRNDTMN